jgi:hypothetical protein
MEKKMIFQRILGDKWDQLPIVFKRHYALREYSDDKITAQGIISVNATGIMSVLAPLMGIMGLLPPYNAKDIPITVVFSSRPDSEAFHFERIFYYPTRAPYIFKSKMIALGDNVVVDLTSKNVGWKMTYDFIDNQMRLTHQGYVLKFFKWYIPLPIGLIMGKCNSYEIALSDTTFKMAMQFTHPWFGVTYEYFGIFTITS